MLFLSKKNKKLWLKEKNVICLQKIIFNKLQYYLDTHLK